MAASEDNSQVVSHQQLDLTKFEITEAEKSHLKLLPVPSDEEGFSTSWHSSEEEDDSNEWPSADYWRREKIVSEDQEKSVIFFVCRGNTCRSAMAVGLARAFVEKHDLPFHIDSFGVSAWSGCRSFPTAVKACRQLGIDISDHRSCDMEDLSEWNKPVKQSFAVICMETFHMEEVIEWTSFKKEQVCTLTENGHVRDPIGDGAKAYRKMLAFLKPLVERHLIRLNNMYYRANLELNSVKATELVQN